MRKVLQELYEFILTYYQCQDTYRLKPKEKATVLLDLETGKRNEVAMSGALASSVWFKI